MRPWLLSIAATLFFGSAAVAILSGQATEPAPAASRRPDPLRSSGAAPDYADAVDWYLHGSRDPLPLPDGIAPLPATAPSARAAIFYVHATTYVAKDRWNAPLGDESEKAAEELVRRQAAILSGLGSLWAPRYRQATLDAFFTREPAGAEALDIAYADVAAAFRAFLAANPTGPIILAGHSQGSRHLMIMLARAVAGRPVAQRIVVAYLPGYPISTSADLPALGLPACRSPVETRCVMNWESYGAGSRQAPDGQPHYTGRGLAGAERAGTLRLCTNPLTGGAQPDALPSANPGMARDDPAAPGRALLVHPGSGAACDPNGFLILSDVPPMGTAVFGDKDYHMYDYALFWLAIRADAERRLRAMGGR